MRDHKIAYDELITNSMFWLSQTPKVLSAYMKNMLNKAWKNWPISTNFGPKPEILLKSLFYIGFNDQKTISRYRPFRDRPKNFKQKSSWEGDGILSWTGFIVPNTET